VNGSPPGIATEPAGSEGPERERARGGEPEFDAGRDDKRVAGPDPLLDAVERGDAVERRRSPRG
jgi:hypothetical protein